MFRRPIAILCLLTLQLFAEEPKPAVSKERAYEGRTLSEWITALNKQESRFDAEAALPHCGADGVRALLHRDHHGVVPSIDLSQLKDAELTTVVPALVEALIDKDVLVRRGAPSWIEQLPPALRKAAISTLIKALSDVDIPVRRLAAETLGHIGADSKAAVPQLIQLMQQEDRDLRGAAMGALGEIGPAAKDAVPLLIEQFRNAKNDFERCSIPLVLGKIGPVTPEVMPTMLAALKSPGMNTRKFAAEGLGFMHTIEAVAPLVAVLKDPNEQPHVRNSAAQALGKLGPSKEAIEPLAAMARNKKFDWEGRGAAMDALVLVDADATTALAVFQENLADPDPLVLIHTADCVGALGRRGKPAVPALSKVLLANRDKGEGFSTARLQAVQALGNIGADEEVIQALKSATTDPDGIVSRVAKETLHKFKK